MTTDRNAQRARIDQLCVDISARGLSPDGLTDLNRRRETAKQRYGAFTEDQRVLLRRAASRSNMLLRAIVDGDWGKAFRTLAKLTLTWEDGSTFNQALVALDMHTTAGLDGSAVPASVSEVEVPVAV